MPPTLPLALEFTIASGPCQHGLSHLSINHILLKVPTNLPQVVSFLNVARCILCLVLYLTP